MFHIFRENRPFFFLFFLFILFGSVLQLFFTKAEILLFVNSHYNATCDFFFEYYTHGGDGAFYMVLLLFFLLFLSFRNFLAGLSAYALTSLVSQFLKRVPFDKVPRPRLYFENMGIKLRLIEGLDVHWVSSFPSGHTIAAFSMATLLSIITPQKTWGVLYFFLALLVGFSRMYLAQHFFEDVFAGAIIGTVFTIISYLLIVKLTDKKEQWKNKSLVRFFQFLPKK